MFDLPGMERNRFRIFDANALDRLAGYTGVGWTTSFCGFLTMGLGYGPGVLGRSLVDTGALLYLGLAFFLATVGLDKLANTVADE